MTESTEGDFLQKNAWWVWRHPHRALDALEDFQLMQEKFDRRIEEFSANSKNFNTQIALKDNQLAQKEQQISELTNQIASLRQTLDLKIRQEEENNARISELEEKLEEYSDLDCQLQAFDRKLSQFEKIKEDYETRIHSLEEQLREAASRTNEGSQHPAFVLDEPASSRNNEETRLPRIDMSDTLPDDWLMDLPDNI